MEAKKYPATSYLIGMHGDKNYVLGISYKEAWELGKRRGDKNFCFHLRKELLRLERKQRA